MSPASSSLLVAGASDAIELMGALSLLLRGHVPEKGMLLLSSPVKTPLPSEKWLSRRLSVRSLSLAIVLRWLLNCSRGYGRVSISSSML